MQRVDLDAEGFGDARSCFCAGRGLAPLEIADRNAVREGRKSLGVCWTEFWRSAVVWRDNAAFSVGRGRRTRAKARL